MKILAPVPRIGVRHVDPAPRPASLTGLTVAICDNWGDRQPDGSVDVYPVLRGIAEGLQRVAGVGDIDPHVEPRPLATPAGDVFSRLAGRDLVLVGCGVSSATSKSVVNTALAFEAAGTPTLVACDVNYVKAIREFAAAAGMADFSVYGYESPTGGSRSSAVISDDIARDIAIELLRPKTSEPPLEPPPPEKEMRLRTLDEWVDLAEARGWTDGLPALPPKRTAVGRMLTEVGVDPDEVVGSIPPLFGIADMREIAIAAVMAGCRPQQFPVVVGALRAILQPAYRLNLAQVATNGHTPLVIVSGPAAPALGFDGSYGAFASVTRANAAVGRALQLLLRNVGGAIPGKTSLQPQGHPGRVSYCVSELVEGNPWEPFHVDRGFPASSTCVTVFGAQAPEAFHVQGSPDRIIRVLGMSMPSPGINAYTWGGEILVAFTLTPALELARSGMTRAEVKQRIWEDAQFDLGALRRSGVIEEGHDTRYWGGRENPPDVEDLPDTARLPLVDGPESIHLLVAGAPGWWWATVCAGWGDLGGLACTVDITDTLLTCR
jgi:hypothetical protein